MVVAWTTTESISVDSRRLQDFANAPDVIANTSSHRWGDAKRLVDAPEVRWITMLCIN
jgi:hypothetical protein